MFEASSKPVSIEVEAVKITADGRRIPLGTIAYYHRNPLRRLWFRITQLFKGA